MINALVLIAVSVLIANAVCYAITATADRICSVLRRLAPFLFVSDD
jgi:hypothetical protein